jgi:hypothetical protein
MIEVNLLPPQNILSQKEKQLRRYLLVMVFGGGAVMVLALFLIFSGHGFFTVRAGILSRQRADLETKVKNETEIVRVLQAVNDKLTGVKIIRDGQTDFAAMLTRLTEIENLGAKVRGVSFGSGDVVEFSVSVPTQAVLKTAFDNLTQKTAHQYFSDIIISGLQENDDRSLSFSVTAKYHE